MSTIWEMAAIIRAEEARSAAPQAARDPAPSSRVSIDAPAQVAYWCRVLGTTPMSLCCAIEQVGREPAALRRFLASRPGRAGRGRQRYA